MNGLKIEMLPIDSLTQYDRNARKHTEKDVGAIERSISTFGFNDPIGIWGKKNIIVEGHGRLQAAKNLGYTELPCIRLDHMTDEQRRAYALAHNKTAELSGWDWGALDAELQDITTVDMGELGFWSDIAASLDDFFEDRGEQGAQKQEQKQKQEQEFALHVVFDSEEEMVSCERLLSENGYSFKRA